MGLILKQSTAVDVIVGPFVDSTDGNTAETGLTVTQAEVRLSKNGGNMAQKNEATSLVHDELGYYDCNLDTTDTNTLGRLQLMIHESGALPVYHEYMVVTAHVYDTYCSTDYFQVDVIQLGGVSQSGTDLKDFADAGYNPATDKVTGVVLVDTTTTNTDMITTAQVNTECDTALTDYDPPTKAEMDTGHGLLATEAKQDTIDGIVDNILVDTGTTLDGNVTAIKAVTDVLPDAGALNDLATILADTNELQGDWTNTGRLDTIIDSILADTGELQTDWVNAGRLDTLLDACSTHAAADVLAVNIEGARTLLESTRIMLGVLAGKSSGGGTATLKFRDTGDAKDRVTATVDADGNRTGMVLDDS